MKKLLILTMLLGLTGCFNNEVAECYENVAEYRTSASELISEQQILIKKQQIELEKRRYEIVSLLVENIQLKTADKLKTESFEGVSNTWKE